MSNHQDAAIGQQQVSIGLWSARFTNYTYVQGEEHHVLNGDLWYSNNVIYVGGEQSPMLAPAWLRLVQWGFLLDFTYHMAVLIVLCLNFLFPRCLRLLRSPYIICTAQFMLAIITGWMYLLYVLLNLTDHAIFSLGNLTSTRWSLMHLCLHGMASVFIYLLGTNFSNIFEEAPVEKGPSNVIENTEFIV